MKIHVRTKTNPRLNEQTSMNSRGKGNCDGHPLSTPSPEKVSDFPTFFDERHTADFTK